MSDAWAAERADVLGRFLEVLSKATGDGSRKRQSGEKPPWYEDKSHEAAVFSHLRKWKAGELIDPDSGAHPLVHAAWRLLAIACSETGNHPVKPGFEPLRGWDSQQTARDFAEAFRLANGGATTAVDGEGDTWTRRGNGRWDLKVTEGPGQRTLGYISETYGLRELS